MTYYVLVANKAIDFATPCEVVHASEHLSEVKHLYKQQSALYACGIVSVHPDKTDHKFVDFYGNPLFKPKLAACAKEFYAKFRKEAGFPTNQPISSTVVPPSGPISLDEYFCEISLPEFRDDENLRILFKFLLSCKLETISWDLVKALLISKDEVLLQKSRKLLQEIFVKIFKERISKISNFHEDFLMEILIYDLLTLYPMIEPHYDNGSFVEIPQKKRKPNPPAFTNAPSSSSNSTSTQSESKFSESWELIKYKIEAFVISESWVKPPMYAYGLIPTCDGTSSIVLFPGTPPPTSTGADVSVFADFVPGHTVGEYIYKKNDMGKNVIQPFVEKLFKEGFPVKLIGKSLGGALAIITCIHLGGKTEVHAFNAPGLDLNLANEYQKNYEEWKSSDKGIPQINVYSQSNDIVSESIGQWPEHCNFFKIVPTIEATQTNGYFAHIQSFISGKQVTVLKLDPKTINEEHSRKILSSVHHVASALMVGPNWLKLLWTSSVENWKNPKPGDKAQ